MVGAEGFEPSTLETHRNAISSNAAPAATRRITSDKLPMTKALIIGNPFFLSGQKPPRLELSYAVEKPSKRQSHNVVTGSSACGSGLRCQSKLSLTHDQRSGPVTTYQVRIGDNKATISIWELN
jgi:hypothetical protein